MNVDDVNDFEIPDFTKLEEIFRRQEELRHKYHDIEARYMLTDAHPLNLHDGKAQYRLKDFAWRVTEEVGEALDAYERHMLDAEHTHVQEELADGLHFLVEMCLLSGFGPLDLVPDNTEMMNLDVLTGLWVLAANYQSIGTSVLPFIQHMSMTMHTLKNKPWKVSQMETDVDEYKKRLQQAFIDYLGIMKTAGMTPNTIYQLYFKKAAVNSFRQRTNY